MTSKKLWHQGVAFAGSCLLAALCLSGGATADEATLDSLVAKIDLELYRQSEADVRRWLDEMIDRYGRFGVYPDHEGGNVRFSDAEARVGFGDGWAAEAPAMFFRAYEMLGEEKYLDAAIRFCDFLLQVQQPEGHFPGSATVRRGDTADRPSSGRVRLQDRYQYPYFALLLYAHRLTGEEKYREAAVRHGELIFGIQNPLEDPFWMGAWPDEVPVSWALEGSPKETVAGTFGVRTGYSHNDYATYDGYRTMVMMYHLTNDAKYIRRIEGLPRWLFDGQLGLGNVRGWTEEYGAHNEPVWARRFESTLIDPRNFNRFAGPMLVQFYAVTGNEAYRNLLRETLDWLNSVEHPVDREPKEGELLQGRFAYKFTYDGREAHSNQYKDRLQPGPITHHGGNVHLENCVWDVRLALGKIDAATAAAGGRGLEAEGSPTTFFEPWDVRGDWTTRAIEVEDWLAIPFRDQAVPVAGVRLAPEAMALRPGAERRIEIDFEPQDASYRTATWTSSDPAVATVVPRMLDEIDPDKVRPTYRREGHMMVTAHSPGRAVMTARSTCGGHTATARVEVVGE